MGRRFVQIKIRLKLKIETELEKITELGTKWSSETLYVW